MSSATDQIEGLASQEYKYGFVTDIDQETLAPGLSEDTVRFISAKKNEPRWLLDWRLKAFRNWQEMQEPSWPNVSYPRIDYQSISYYAAPKSADDRPKSLDEVDPELLATYEKLGIPLEERAALAGVAVDAVFDSVSVATTFRERLADAGVIFMSISEAVREHPDLVRRYLGSVVPPSDNFFAALNSAVFSDGSFVFIPKGVACPMELSTYFRINAMNTGQFERTLIVAEEGATVSYLEGCTAPMRDENQLHAAVVELVALDDARIKYSTVQNWYPGDKDGNGGIYNFVTKRGACQGRNSKISWTQVENGLGDHLEVPELHPDRRQLDRRILLGGSHQQPPTGRYRHEDDPHRQEHLVHDRVEGDFRGGLEQLVSRTGQDHAQGRGRAQLLAVRLDADGRPLRRPYLPLSGGSQQVGPSGTRGDDFQDRRGPDLLLEPARHRNRGRRVDDRQRILQGGLP